MTVTRADDNGSINKCSDDEEVGGGREEEYGFEKSEIMIWNFQICLS